MAAAVKERDSGVDEGVFAGTLLEKEAERLFFQSRKFNELTEDFLLLLADKGVLNLDVDVLELGCGPGATLPVLAGCFTGSITGLDIDGRRIRLAEMLAEEQGFGSRFRGSVQDITEPWDLNDKKFGYIGMRLVTQHLRAENRHGVMRQAAERLDEEGVLGVEDLNVFGGFSRGWRVILGFNERGEPIYSEALDELQDGFRGVYEDAEREPEMGSGLIELCSSVGLRVCEVFERRVATPGGHPWNPAHLGPLWAAAQGMEQILGQDRFRSLMAQLGEDLKNCIVAVSSSMVQVAATKAA